MPIEVVSVHRTRPASRHDSLGFIVVTSHIGQLLGVSFDDATVGLDERIRRTDLAEFCAEAPLEMLLDFLLLSKKLRSVNEIEIILEKTARRLGRLSQPSIQTPQFRASIDDGWASVTSESLAFYGSILCASGENVESQALVLAGAKSIPVDFCPNSIAGPEPLNGASGDTNIYTGFVGASGQQRRSVFAPTAFVILKDGLGGCHAIWRRLKPASDGELFENVVGCTARTLKLPREPKELASIFGSLFPYQIQLPAYPGATKILRSDKTRTCHLLLDVRSDAGELRSIVSEIIRDRFSRILLTCVANDEEDAGLADLFESLKHDFAQVNVRVVEWGDDIFGPADDLCDDDLVLVGHPMSILQFDLEDDAIDKAVARLDAGELKSLGYLHRDVSGDRDRAGQGDIYSLFKPDVFASARGFAAFMPAAHLRPPTPEANIPLCLLSSLVKLKLLALAKLGVAELRLVSGMTFYEAANDANVPDGLARILERIDHCRCVETLNRLAPECQEAV